MSFGQEFITLFKNMPIAAICCLILGVVCIIVEIFKPGFGIFGILGGVLTIAGIIIRTLVGDGNIFFQIIVIIFMDVVFAAIGFLTMYLLARFGFLKRTPFIQSGTAVGLVRSEGTLDNGFLVGKEGVATTNLHPLGKADIEGEIYDVVSNGIFIDKEEKIKVIAVEGSEIKVTRAQNGK